MDDTGVIVGFVFTHIAFYLTVAGNLVLLGIGIKILLWLVKND